MFREEIPLLNSSCVSDVPIPIHGMIDAHAYHCNIATWPTEMV